MRKPILGLVLIIIISVSGKLSAQTAPIGSAERERLLNQSTKQLLDDLEQIRRRLASGVDPSELTILNSVEFRVPDAHYDDFINCVAGRDSNGTRVVSVGLGFARAIRMFADGELLARALNDPAKGNEYIEYIREKWNENGARSRKGEDPVPVESPYEHFHASDELIEEISDMSNRAYTGSLAFAVAHEVGHHVLNEGVGIGNPSLDEEKRADDWAMKTMVSAGEPPTAGILVMSFYSNFFTADASHPDPDERVIDMVQTTLDNLDRFSARARANGVSIEEYRSQLTDGLRQLKASGTGQARSVQSSQGAGSFLSALQEVVNDIPSRFSNLIGEEESRRTSSVGPTTTYRSKITVPDFDQCTIAVEDFRRGLRTEFVCQTGGGETEGYGRLFFARASNPASGLLGLDGHGGRRFQLAGDSRR